MNKACKIKFKDQNDYDAMFPQVTGKPGVYQAKIDGIKMDTCISPSSTFYLQTPCVVRER